MQPDKGGSSARGVSRGSSKRSDESTFRGDIEGLRALAVLGVVLFHAHIPNFGGGFVGVDVFYVISGFLITGLIVSEIERTGRLALARFWGRRMRRLLPAAGLVLVATLSASLIVLDPLSLGQTAKDAMAAAAYVANWWFAHQAVDYLATDIPPSPVLHYWSLSVEEQFYLVWPLVFAGIAAFASRRRIRAFMRRQFGFVVAVIGVTSFALSIVLTHTNAPFAFFSTPTRAWQLALGAGLALTTKFWSRLEAIPRLALGAIGLMAVGYSFATLSDANASTPYPGLLALIPTLGTAAAIAAGIRHDAPTLIQRFLSLRPLRFLGRISYSWYLWHWPPLVLLAAYVGRDLRLTERLACVTLSLLLAWLTYRWVEDPIRRARPLVASAWKSVGVGVVSTAAVLGFSFAVPAMAGDTGRIVSPPASGVTLPNPTMTSTYAAGTYVIGPRQAKADKPSIYKNGCMPLLTNSVTQLSCVFGNVKASKTVMLFGDSHAAQWFPALEAAANRKGYRLIVRTRAGCPWYSLRDFAVRGKTWPGCTTWQRARLNEIASLKPDVLVLASIERFYRVRSGSTWLSERDSQSAINAAIISTLPELKAASSQVIVLHDTPHMDVDVPNCVARHLREPQKCAMPRDKGFALGGADVKAATTVPGIATLDLTPTLCGPAPRPCDVVRQGMVLYRDSNHVTATYSRLFAKSFEKLLN